MKILLVAHNFLPYCCGGVEIYVRDLAQIFQQRGHAVRVLYPRYATADSTEMSLQDGAFEGIPITEGSIRLTQHDATWLVRNDRIKPLLRQHLASHPVDIVHIHHLFGWSVSCLDVLDELGIPAIWTLHDFWLPCFEIHLMDPQSLVCSGPESIAKCTDCILARFRDGTDRQRAVFEKFLESRRWAHHQAIRKPKVVLSISQFIHRFFQRYDLVNRAMICMPTGIRLFPLETPVPREGGAIRFAFLGSISPTKGLDLLIDAFHHVDCGKARLHVYGAISDQGYFERVMQSIAPSRPIVYQGKYSSDDLPRILARTDVVVVPSRAETYPQVVREALHGRVPVIAANVGGIPEIIADGKNGLLFNGNDARDLAAKLNMLIADPGLMVRLRDGIRPVRSIEEDVVALEDLYRRITRR